MRWIFGLAFVLLCVGIFSVPDLASAQGLVPASCRGDNVPVTCGTCEFVQLVNNVIQFVIVIMSSVAVLVFMFAGFKLLTSGGNATARQSAVSLFSNVAIGYVLILGSFLIVDLIFRSVLDTNNSALLNWRTVQCVYPKAPTEGTVPGTLSPGSSVTAGTGRGAGGGSCSILNSGECAQDKLSCFGDGAAASRVCNIESNGGKASSVSSTDLCKDGKSFSGGLFQINVLANHALVPGCSGDFFEKIGSSAQGECLDEKTNSVGVKYCAVRNCRITNIDMYNTCMTNTLNPRINREIACKLYENGGYNHWITSARRCEVI